MTLVDSGRRTAEWIAVARVDDVVPDRGVAARLGGEQIAVFVVSSEDAVFAIGNRDPFSGANVLSRGIVGDRAGEPKVASPIYKQSFSLRTGICLDDPTVRVPVYEARVRDGTIEVRHP